MTMSSMTLKASQCIEGGSVRRVSNHVRTYELARYGFLVHQVDGNGCFLPVPRVGAAFNLNREETAKQSKR